MWSSLHASPHRRRKRNVTPESKTLFSSSRRTGIARAACLRTVRLPRTYSSPDTLDTSASTCSTSSWRLSLNNTYRYANQVE